MANIGTVEAILGADTRQWTAGLKSAETQMRTLESTVKRSDANLKLATRTIGAQTTTLRAGVQLWSSAGLGLTAMGKGGRIAADSMGLLTTALSAGAGPIGAAVAAITALTLVIGRFVQRSREAEKAQQDHLATIRQQAAAVKLADTEMARSGLENARAMVKSLKEQEAALLRGRKILEQYSREGIVETNKRLKEHDQRILEVRQQLENWSTFLFGASKQLVEFRREEEAAAAATAEATAALEKQLRLKREVDAFRSSLAGMARDVTRALRASGGLGVAGAGITDTGGLVGLFTPPSPQVIVRQVKAINAAAAQVHRQAMIERTALQQREADIAAGIWQSASLAIQDSITGAIANAVRAGRLDLARLGDDLSAIAAQSVADFAALKLGGGLLGGIGGGIIGGVAGGLLGDLFGGLTSGAGEAAAALARAAQAERERARALQETLEQARESLSRDLEVRRALLDVNGRLADVRVLEIRHMHELADVAEQFGRFSPEATLLRTIQLEEELAAAREKAAAAAERLLRQQFEAFDFGTDLRGRELKLAGDPLGALREQLSGQGAAELQRAQEMLQAGTITIDMFKRLEAVLLGEFNVAMEEAAAAAQAAADAERMRIQQAEEDLRVRELLALGETDAARALERQLKAQREIEQAIAAGMSEEFIDQLKQVLALEAAATGTGTLAEAERVSRAQNEIVRGVQSITATQATTLTDIARSQLVKLDEISFNTRALRGGDGVAVFPDMGTRAAFSPTIHVHAGTIITAGDPGAAYRIGQALSRGIADGLDDELGTALAQQTGLTGITAIPRRPR